MKVSTFSVVAVTLFLANRTGMASAQEDTSTAAAADSDSAREKLEFLRRPPSVYIFAREKVLRLPIRELDEIVALENGVVRQDGNLHFRGGRADRAAYFLDGMPVHSSIPRIFHSSRKLWRKSRYTPASMKQTLWEATP